MQTTKREVLSYVKDLTKNINFDDLSAFTASSISESLSISRSLASQYLNELHREGYLIKVISRPVIFIYIDLLKYSSQSETLKLEYLSLDELLRDVSGVVEEHLFTDVVGYNGSLKALFNNAKASIAYPPFGLPLLLLGDCGVGKALIAKTLYNYARSNNNIAFNQKMISLEIIDYELAIQTLKKLIDSKEIAFIYVYNLSSLDAYDQIRLIEFIESKIEKHIVYASNPVGLDPKVISKMSFTVKVPRFLERPSYEREQLVVNFLIEESQILDRKFYITQSIIKALSNYSYEEEILGLKKTITNICAKSILDYTIKDVKVLNYQVAEVIDVSLEFDDDYILVEDYFIVKHQILIEAYQSCISNTNLETLDTLFSLVDSEIHDDDFNYKDIYKHLKESIMVIEDQKLKRYLLNQLRVLTKMIIIQERNDDLLKEISSIEGKKIVSDTAVSTQLIHLSDVFFNQSGITIKPIHSYLIEQKYILSL